MPESNKSIMNLNQNNENSMHKKKSKYTFKDRVQSAKEAFLEWSSRTDMNNYGKIFVYKGNILAQIIWIIIFLVLSGLTVLLIQQSISAYLSYSVTSTYETIYESPLEFPTVTLCASNPFASQEAKNLFRHLISNYSLNIYLTRGLTGLTELAKMHASNPTFGDENRKKLGFSIDDINSCKFDNVDCKNDLHWIWLYDYGNCFQFNSGLNISNQKIDFVKSSRLDKGSGLSFDLNPNYIHIGYIKNISYSFSIFEYIILIHNSSNLISSSTKLFFFKNFDKLTMRLKRTSILKQPWPYSDCIDLSSYSSVLYDYIIESNYSYRQIDCLDLCIQQKIISECECYNLKYPDLNTQVKPCLNLTQYECANGQINTFISDDCISTFCPLECSSIEYESENSFGDHGSYFEYRGVTAFEFESLTMSYSNLKYTVISESPQTTFVNLLTQFGGSIGMFISFSVFTLFELLEVFFLIFYAFIRPSHSLNC